MTLPELRTALSRLVVPTVGDRKLREMFVDRLAAWRKDQSTAEDLLQDMNRLLGHVWFKSPDVHQKVFELIEALAKIVGEIDGMTMNERLVNFGLLEKWNRSSVVDQRLIRRKLGAA
jgi:hypothetical protein